MRRRTLIQAAGGSVAALAAPVLLSKERPNAPLRIVVGFAPGGGTDGRARSWR